MFKYEEFTIEDQAMVAAVINGNKSLTESGILDELNKICAEREVEVDWTFTGGFPQVFMLKRPLTLAEIKKAKAAAKAARKTEPVPE